jgi:hypothetical protein
MSDGETSTRSAAAHINSIAAIVHDYLNSGIIPNTTASGTANDDTIVVGHICPFCTGTGFKGTFGCPHCGGSGRV